MGGLLAGTFAGLVSIFPAYYVNWSRYTQGLGLALLPVSIVLYLEVVQRPWRRAVAGTVPGGVPSTAPAASPGRPRYAIRGHIFWG